MVLRALDKGVNPDAMAEDMQVEMMSFVKDDVLDYFRRAVRGEVTGKGRSIGKLTEEGRVYLERLSGLRMSKTDIDFVLNPSDLKHIYNDHYGDNEKDKGNNIPYD